MKTIIKYSVTFATIGFSSRALATPRPLPFTYPYETNAEGELELEIYGDVSPVRVDALPPGAQGSQASRRLWEPAYQLQNEIEYGINDRIELGYYQVFEAKPLDGGANTMVFDGFKWRVRGRLAEAGQWPIDVALYLELETLHDETALEEKVILAKRFGRWHWMANLWVEESEHRPLDSRERSFHFVVNPTTGLTYEVTSMFQPGAEYWARGELGTVGDSVDIANNRVHHFLGPTVHVDFGKLWWSAGVYVDLNNTQDPQPNEIYGPVWVRTVVGLSL
ncbi:MAG: hypothetical protein M3O46_19470 [Myxococcota bacterium]|nr:hypothetical protein [Myxococcota bacterium]